MLPSQSVSGSLLRPVRLSYPFQRQVGHEEGKKDLTQVAEFLSRWTCQGHTHYHRTDRPGRQSPRDRKRPLHSASFASPWPWFGAQARLWCEGHHSCSQGFPSPLTNSVPQGVPVGTRGLQRVRGQSLELTVPTQRSTFPGQSLACPHH